jgi:hypothetical protein
MTEKTTDDFSSLFAEELPLPKSVTVIDAPPVTPVTDSSFSEFDFNSQAEPRKRGRPKGSKNRVKETSSSAVLSAEAYAGLWSGLGALYAQFSHDPKWILKEEESLALGKASLPLAEKYGVDFLGKYVAEINFGICAFGVIAPRIFSNHDNREKREGENVPDGNGIENTFENSNGKITYQESSDFRPDNFSPIISAS